MSKFHAVFGLGLLLAAVVLVSRVPNSVGADITAPAESKAVAIGAPAPAWKDLSGVDGKTHSLADLAKAKAIVVVFTCNHCPVAQGYENRLNELAAGFQDKGVEVVAINVNNSEADKLPAMKEHAEEKGFKFAYLYDPSQAIGRAFGASVTPHAFVLDGNRNVVYMGAIDDNMMPDKVTQHYVRDAVESVLAGRQPATTTSKQFGCGIQYE